MDFEQVKPDCALKARMMISQKTDRKQKTIALQTQVENSSLSSWHEDENHQSIMLCKELICHCISASFTVQIQIVWVLNPQQLLDAATCPNHMIDLR